MKLCGYEGCKKPPARDEYGGVAERCSMHKGKHVKKRRSSASRGKARRRAKKGARRHSAQSRKRVKR